MPINKYTELEVRLMKGRTEMKIEGRVEVRQKGIGQWGTICNDNFDDRDATVICRMLNFEWGEQINTISPGSNDQRIYLDELECTGDEPTLYTCHAEKWSHHNCEHEEDSSVKCHNTTVRLRNSNKIVSSSELTYGRLIVFKSKLSLEVCSSALNVQVADLACKLISEDYKYSKISSKIWIPVDDYRLSYSVSKITCKKDEQSFMNCEFTPNQKSCRSVSVLVCSKSIIEKNDNINMAFKDNGMVKITTSGVEAVLCNLYTTDNDATVACKHAGYNYGKVIAARNTGGKAYPYVGVNLNCTGQETSIFECSGWKSPSEMRNDCTRFFQDTSVICYKNNFKISLVDISKKNPNTGVVQMEIDGKFGTICGLHWGSLNARILCRSIGGDNPQFIDGVMAPALSNVGKGDLLLENVVCRGSEMDILKCSNNGWKVSNSVQCRNHRYDAAVKCFRNVKLYSPNGADNSGLVDLYDHNSKRWARVCGIGFTDAHAKLVCTQYGFKNGKSLCCSVEGYQPYRGLIASNFICTNNSTNLGSCKYQVGNQYCSDISQNYASVVCYNGESQGTTLSLEGGYYSANYVGRLRATIGKGMSGRVCNVGWTDNNAKVACRMLNFKSGIAYQYLSLGRGPFVMTGVNCKGTEANIDQCGRLPIRKSCHRDAGVLCFNDSPPEIELIGGPNQDSGTILVTFMNQTGTICDELWSDISARILCRSLNEKYTDGKAYMQSHFGQGIGLIYFSGAYCSGNELSIFQCSNYGFRATTKPSCLSHRSDAGVKCYKNIRLFPENENLVNKTTSGQVQIHTAFGWGLVCALNFGQLEANVVCRELGYQYAKSLRTNFFESGYRSYAIRNVRCVGNESSILNCAHERDGEKCPDQQWNFASVACANKSFDESVEVYMVKSDRQMNYTGYVRIRKYGIIGKVCYKQWGDKEAGIFCRQMGFNDGKAYNFNTQSRIPFWITNIKCKGSEKNLQDCVFNNDQLSDCNSANRKEAGVLCFMKNVNFQLSEGSSGYLTVTYDGQVGQICGQDLKNEEASVVCSQAGYEKGLIAYGPKKNNLPFFTQVTKCDGDEKSILQCANRGWKKTSFCQFVYIPLFKCIRNLQLIGSKSVNMVAGALKIAVQSGTVSNWYSICAEGWDDRDAKVACRQLGYNNGRAAYSIKGRYEEYIRYMHSEYECKGSEKKLQECTYKKSDWVYGLQCDAQIGYASAMCYKSEPLDFFIVKISSTVRDYAGVPIINYSGIDGFICANGWSDEDATVFCRQKNPIYTQGIAYKHYQSSRTAIYWLDSLKCKGSETSLNDCQHSGYGNITEMCNSGPAGVLCLDKNSIKFKLSDEKNRKGRVDITINGETGTFCNLNYFDNLEASAICRTINPKFTGGLRDRTEYPKGTGPIWSMGLNCRENVKDIYECSSSGWSPPRPHDPSYITYSACLKHNNDVTVICYEDVRIYDARSSVPNYGQLQVYQRPKNQWVSVCQNAVDQKTVDLICKEFGYSSGQLFCCNIHNMNNKAITKDSNMVKKVNCVSNAKKFSDCKLEYGQCSDFVSLLCSNDIKTTKEMKLHLNGPESGPSREIISGSIEVEKNGIKGYICGKNMTVETASVICKSFGKKSTFVSGFPFSYHGARLGSAPFLFSINCTGKEDNISECKLSPLGQHTGCISNDNAAGVICSTEETAIKYRIISKDFKKFDDTSYGRVQVYYNGIWGSVCGSSWNYLSAKVFCQSLGFSDGSVHKADTNDRNNPFFVSQVFCKGNEKNIFECPNGEFYPTADTCRQYGSSAGVYCYRKAKIEYSKPRAFDKVAHGLVKIYQDSNTYDNWFKVCNKGFTNKEASVVCRTMGFQYGISFCCNAYGIDTRAGSMVKISCKYGNESSLSSCKLQSCQDLEYASVACSHNKILPTNEYEIRLENGVKDQSTGKVKVKIAGVEGRLCADGWTDEDAKVVCRSLGFNGGQAYQHNEESNVFYSPFNGPYWSNKFNCNGNEKRIGDCKHIGWGNIKTCKSKHAAGVICYRNHGVYFRIGKGNSSRGTIQVAVDGVWGTLCDDLWGANDAKVMCRMMGYADGRPLYNSHFGPGSGPIYANGFRCNGNETSLLRCSTTGWKPATRLFCRNHEEDAGVECFHSVRFYKYTSKNTSGPLQIYTNNTWQVICSDNFTDEIANEACIKLGFDYGLAICCSAYGNIFPRTSVFSNQLDFNPRLQKFSDLISTRKCITNTYASAACFHKRNLDNPQKKIVLEKDKSGRVFVDYLKTKWKICGNGWDDEDAVVACRSVGFTHGKAYRHIKYFPSDIEHPYIMSNVSCLGTEKNLLDCERGNRFELNNCSDQHDAAVICFNDTSEKTIEFSINGSSSEGRVMVEVGGTRATLCNIAFNQVSASILCKQNGFSEGFILKDTTEYEKDTGLDKIPIWVHNLKCSGQEKTLRECPHTGFDFFIPKPYPSSTNSLPSQRPAPCMTHKQDAFIKCVNSPIIGRDYTSFEGAIQAFNKEDGSWQLVCSDSFSQREALVACKTHGFNYATIINGSAFLPLYMKKNKKELTEFHDYNYANVKCKTGEETSYDQCSVQFKYKGCKSKTYASVVCSNTVTKPLTTNWSLMKLKQNNLAMPYTFIIATKRGNMSPAAIFNKGFTNKEAMVSCRELGYSSGYHYRLSHSTDLPIAFHNIKCTGEEKKLRDCKNIKEGAGERKLADIYNVNFAAGVLCYNTFKLEITSNNRAEICVDGKCYSICSLSDNSIAANLFCKMKNYKSGLKIKGSGLHTGSMNGYWPSFLCTEADSSLFNCNSAHCGYYGIPLYVHCFEKELEISNIVLSSSTNEGIVTIEIESSTERGWICADTFGVNEARVICNYLGYEKGRVLKVTNPINDLRKFFNKFTCPENATSIDDCEYSFFDSYFCLTKPGAGVSCSVPIITKQNTIETTKVTPTRSRTTKETSTGSVSTEVTNSQTTEITSTKSRITKVTPSSITAKTKSTISSSTSAPKSSTLKLASTASPQVKQNKQKDNSISKSTIIGVSCAVGLVILILIAFFICYKTRRERLQTPRPTRMSELPDPFSANNDGLQFSNRIYEKMSEPSDMRVYEKNVRSSVSSDLNLVENEEFDA
ncbi:DgyrCDS12557 [Dimorphilus gyrociliatus]|uniref:DgyrCDS12557 n=1 Tax=Dimorphilus gyrociliatus TaxID=2664684 RepID=A0A7I8W6U2_9ANNE|nr:DgyrCDS12557 [Dimorphilus gyrociliatus]